MGKECEFCGKKPQVGHHVSHSNIKTKRRFNYINKSYFLARMVKENETCFFIYYIMV